MRVRDDRSGQSGFTLPEVMIVIAIMGILAAIAIPTWWSVVEGRRVDSATNQVAADMRLAHSAATNRLGTARLIFRNNGGPVDCNGDLASYCVTMPMIEPDGTTGTEFTPRYLPPDDRPFDERVQLSSPNILADPASGTLPPGVVPGTTSTVEFTSNGSARVLGSLGAVAGDCPAGTPAGERLRVVSADADIRHCITFNTATSRIKID